MLYRICFLFLACLLSAVTPLNHANEPRHLRVGFYENPPAIFTNQDGDPDGILVELLQKIAEKEGWSIQYVTCTWAVCLESLRSGQLDLLDATYTDARAEQFSFTQVPVIQTWSQVYRKPGSPINAVADLSGKKIAVLRDSSQADGMQRLLDSHGVKASLVLVDSVPDGFESVKKGAADVAVTDNYFGSLHASKFGLADTPIIFQPSRIMYATLKGKNLDVLAALDRHLAILQSNPDSEYYDILREWRPETGIFRIPRTVRWGIVVVLGLLMSSLATALYLRRRVSTQTLNLKTSEQKLATILESVESPIYIKDRAYRYTYVNRAVCELFGKPADEILGKHDSDLLGQKTAAAIHEKDQLVIEDGKRIKVEESKTDPKNGRERTFLATKIPLKGRNGQPYALCGISTDITDRKKTEDSLRVAATVFHSQEGMFVTGPDTHVLDANAAFLQMTGYEPRDLLGKPLPQIACDGSRVNYWPAIWKEAQQHGKWQGEVWTRRKDGTEFPARLTVTAVRNDDNQITHYVGTQTDTTQQRLAQEQITRLAYYDPLTGLPNRQLLMDRLRHSLAAQRRFTHANSLLFIDLDNFKDLNDTRGHAAGDDLLRQVGRRILGCCRESDTVARLGGDEFVVLMENTGMSAQEATTHAYTVARKILNAIAEPYTVNGSVHRCTGSIGAYVYLTPEVSIEDLMRRGDLAMYEAKRAGRNTVCLFDDGLERAVNRRTMLEAQIREGLDKGQFRLYFQAQFDVHGRIVGAEALVRWEHPGRGLISPNEFIEVAETTGLILPLGDWVMAEACRHLASWSKSSLPQVPLAVNVSVRQLRRPDFVERTLVLLEEAAIAPSLLKLELTESMLIDDLDDTIAKMQRLKVHGLGFSLDDFGTGYSSLSYLKQLPLDQLKIDRSFVRDVLTDSNDAAIATSIVALGKALGLHLVAEGVELQEQHEFLTRAGCDMLQGYLYARPCDETAFRDLVHKTNASYSMV